MGRDLQRIPREERGERLPYIRPFTAREGALKRRQSELNPTALQVWSRAVAKKKQLNLQRLEEARIALFSRWSSATLAWNREETGSGFQPPSATFYTQLLVSSLLPLHISNPANSGDGESPAICRMHRSLIGSACLLQWAPEMDVSACDVSYSQFWLVLCMPPAY